MYKVFIYHTCWHGIKITTHNNWNWNLSTRNSILLLLARRDSERGLIIERDVATVARLSEGASRSGRLSPVAIERALAVLREYAVVAKQAGLPGELGKAVSVPKDREEEKKRKFKINQFNLVASEMISLNRSLQDVRLSA